jgi:hypothetical protein
VRSRAALLGGAALLLTGCTAPTMVAPVGHAELTLVGDWVGGPAGEAAALRMTVDRAAEDGSTFDGVLHRDGASDPPAPMRARMTPHGHLVASIGADASIELHISGPATMDYCLIVYGDAPDYSCGRLSRSG